MQHAWNIDMYNIKKYKTNKTNIPDRVHNVYMINIQNKYNRTDYTGKINLYTGEHSTNGNNQDYNNMYYIIISKTPSKDLQVLGIWHLKCVGYT